MAKTRQSKSRKEKTTVRATQNSWKSLIVDSPAARTQESRAKYEVVVEKGLRVPMQDGTELGAMLWRPKRSGRYPVLVERDPHRGEWRTGKAGEYYAARGYVVVHVSLRGCGESEGEFTGPMPGSPPGDGYDTIEWAATQPWSNRRVGMLCGSISGFTQYQTAVEAPPHLQALFVREAGGFQGFRSFFGGGAFPLYLAQGVAASWTEHRLERFPPAQQAKGRQLLKQFKVARAAAAEGKSLGDPHDPTRLAAVLVPSSISQRLPLTPYPLFAEVADYYNDWLAHAKESAWWKPGDLRPKVDQAKVPICHLGGLFDGCLPNTLAAFMSMRDQAATPFARNSQRLIIGPWVHGPEFVGKTQVGLLEFGPQARLDYYAFRGRWYDHHLRRRSTGIKSDPPVWLYVIGPDRWLGCDTWPPPGMISTSWYLRTGDEKGVLAIHPPDTAERPDAYEYDPRNPIPSLQGGGPLGMGLDQALLEHRLTTYTSPPLKRPLALIGPLKTVLYAASSAPDTDWVVKLTWVRPDGTSIILSGGILRARFRHSLARPKPLNPDKPTRFEVEMMPLSIEIPASHCLRLTVTSSDFPEFDRNLNTGGPIGRERRSHSAINLLFHDRLRPSHILLPVVC